MTDGRYEEVISLIEVNIGLREMTVRMQLLILHNIIDALVLGWDFLTRVGA